MPLLGRLWTWVGHVWARQSTLGRVLFAFFILPFLVFPALLGLAFEFLGFLDRRHRLPTGYRWALAVPVSAVALVGLAIVGSLTSNPARGGSEALGPSPTTTQVPATTPGAAATLTATPSPTAAPTDTPAPTRDAAAAGWSLFQLHVQVAANLFGSDLDAYLSPFNAGDLVGAETAAKQLAADGRDELAWLDANPADPCYASVWADWRQGISLMTQAAVTASSDPLDPTAATTMDSATTAMRQAQADGPSVACP